jgi:hypothetical protein
MNKSLLIVIIATGTLYNTVIASENLFDCRATNGTGAWIGQVKTIDDGKDQKCFVVNGSKKIMSKELIPIDATATYKISVSLKSGTAKPNKIYFGLEQYDAQKRNINSTSITPVEDSATTLVAPANKGDKIIKIKAVKNWQAILDKKRLLIAFDIDDSGAYSDLPNFKVSNSVTSLKQQGDNWEATLKTPLEFSFPNGTKVRAQLKCGHLMYAVALTKHLPNWTTFSREILPAKKFGSHSGTLWTGVKFARVMFLANWRQKDGEIMLFKNVKLEKVEN